jgi:hypothetical protein
MKFILSSIGQVGSRRKLSVLAPRMCLSPPPLALRSIHEMHSHREPLLRRLRHHLPAIYLPGRPHHLYASTNAPHRPCRLLLANPVLPHGWPGHLCIGPPPHRLRRRLTTDPVASTLARLYVSPRTSSLSVLPPHGRPSLLLSASPPLRLDNSLSPLSSAAIKWYSLHQAPLLAYGTIESLYEVGARSMRRWCSAGNRAHKQELSLGLAHKHVVICSCDYSISGNFCSRIVGISLVFNQIVIWISSQLM